MDFLKVSLQMKIKIMKPVTANVRGESVYYEPGEEVDIHPEDAGHLVAGGYAEYIRPASKVVIPENIEKRNVTK